MSAQDVPAPLPVTPSTAAAEGLRYPWWRSLVWVPSLYFAMGIPFNVVMGGTAARMYKSLGYPDGKITIALGYIGIAWSLKPLWAAFLDMYRTKKFFVLLMEVVLGALFTAVAMSVPAPGFFQISIALLWVAAFASSTQDICADGVYLTALDRSSQARLAGVQGTFWVLGKVFAAGVLISVVDKVRAAEGWSPHRMWSTVMLACAASMVLLAVYHFFYLPTGSISERPANARQVVDDFVRTAITFFHKRSFWGMIAFVFLYRLGEGLILMEGQLFLQSDVARGGLGLSPGEVSSIDALYGTVASILGGLIGGLFVSWMTLPRALGILGLCLNVPHFTYLFMSHAAAGHHGLDYTNIVTAVSIEKFGYGFGFVGNMVYMMQQLAPGRSTMTHYAFATALMNFMLVPTNMISGPLAEWLGFSTFFFVVMFASVPSVWAAFKAPFPLGAEGARPAQPAQAVGSSDQRVVTVDDPSVLTAEQREVQERAGRASMFAMLDILVILVLDARFLGSLREAEPGSGARLVYLVLLLGDAVLKGWLALRTLRSAGEAERHADRIGDTAYRGNARGAKVATAICGVVSVVVLAVAAAMAL
jgi:MFS transporter, PAT family, beta-lactamase induction signal transducer AmpG